MWYKEFTEEGELIRKRPISKEVIGNVELILVHNKTFSTGQDTLTIVAPDLPTVNLVVSSTHCKLRPIGKRKYVLFDFKKNGPAIISAMFKDSLGNLSVLDSVLLPSK